MTRRNGYTLEETVAILKDGTRITKLVQVPIGSKAISTTEEVADDQ